MLDLIHLKSFIAVATTSNFTRAAREIGYSQGSVSHHIHMLEKQLGVRLFYRFRFAHNIVLTPVGETTLEYAKRVLALVEETEKTVRKMA